MLVKKVPLTYLPQKYFGLSNKKIDKDEKENIYKIFHTAIDYGNAIFEFLPKG